MPPPEELLPSPTPTVPEGLPTVPGTITIDQFQFSGNTAFSAQELAAVTEPYTDRPLSFAELLQARSAITQYYVDNGYVTSGAFIPPQELENGVLTVEVVEGNLQEINVEVNGRLDPDYVRDRLKLAANAPLNVPRLVEALQLLQLNPLVETISAELSAGTRPGTSILDVEVDLADTFTAQAILDNARSPSVGSFRRTAQLSHANLLGFGDELSFAYRNTDGSDDFDVAYTLPFNARNGTIRLGYRDASSEVIEEDFEDLGIESDFSRYELTLRQPIILTPNRELALGISAERLDSEIVFSPEPLNEEIPYTETQITALRFFQEWVQRGEQEVFAARSQFSFGLDVDATENISNITGIDNEEPPDDSFVSWRGQAQWVRLLAPDTLLLARTDVQLATSSLVALEQIGLGGIGSVRGYRQDVLLADSGILGSVELRLPILRVPQQEMVLQVVPFFDVGTAWNNGDADEDNLDPNTLVSVGLGLNYQIGDRFSARLDWGIPLVDTDVNNDGTLQENGLHFSINYIPF